MKIHKIKAKSIITKSNLPEADYVVNPYIGCMHSCIYCYARFMKRFTGHSEPWGKFVDIKINAPDLIPEKTNKYFNKSIFLSSVTDPYLSLERKYKLTRKILKKLIPLKPKLGIQTKSELILRDIDLLKQFQDCAAGLTITTLDSDLQKQIEPFASSPNARINALKKLKQSKIKTYVFIGPIMPYLTDWKKIILKTKKYAHSYMFENLNVRGSIWPQIKTWLKAKHQDLLAKYENIYFSKNDFWNKIETEIKAFCKEKKVKYNIYFHH
ncbi:radical SAM protein [bacterium]|nr:radical SAM protein [bacterium]|tara:strand:- start:8045 stop:8848 length:804 start_codon:yes stop_codon:yes gene_type:complete